MYMAHEIDVAANKTAFNVTDDAAGAPHNLDEAYGIWAGDGKGECSPLGLAKEAVQAAGTGNDIAAETLNLYLTMQAASRTGNAAKFNAARDTFIKRGIVLPHIQMVLKQAQEMTTDAGTAAQASAFAYFRTILPYIKAASTSDADAISNAINISGAPQANAHAAIQKAFASVLPYLGFTKADLGVLAPASPSPPPPQSCSYKGNFRLRSVSCPTLLIATSLDCSSTAITLRKSSDATGDRTIWKFDQGPGAFGAINSARKCLNSVFAVTSVPSLATSGKFKASPVILGDCKTVSLVAEKPTSKGTYLAANKACTALSWTSSDSSSQAKFTIASA
jgi:Low iron-inducible periplasmic protein